MQQFPGVGQSVGVQGSVAVTSGRPGDGDEVKHEVRSPQLQDERLLAAVWRRSTLTH